MTLGQAQWAYREAVSPHFQLWEFVYSATAEKLGIDNSPADWVVRNIKFLAENLLEPLRRAWGKPIRIASKGGSGYRCEALNNAVGGASSTSQHRFALAADLHIDGKPIELAKCLLESGLRYDQCIVYPWGCHVGLKREGNRKQLLYSSSYKGERL